MCWFCVAADEGSTDMHPQPRVYKTVSDKSGWLPSAVQRAAVDLPGSRTAAAARNSMVGHQYLEELQGPA
jgi:hypothetical protein